MIPTLKRQTNEIRPPLPVMIVIALVAIFLTFFYVSYAQSAWFYQDDFNFLVQYASSLKHAELFNFSNFGRFLSRNVYWHYGIEFFSFNAQYFYLANWAFIFLTSLLTGKVVAARYGTVSGVIAGLFYYALPSTIAAYSWISNSQHIIGHFFVLLFVYVYMTSAYAIENRIRYTSIAALSVILVLGYLSNIFMSMVVSLPVWMLICDAKYRKDVRNYIVPLVGAVLFVYFYVHLRSQQTEAYSTSFKLSVVAENARYYYRNALGSVLWIAAVMIGALYALKKRNFALAWLFLASLVFFVPFAFLEHQKYSQYGVLSQLFLLLALWCCALEIAGDRFLRSAWYAGLFVTVVIFLASMSTLVSYYSLNPDGQAVRKQVEQLRAYEKEHPEVMHYCFRPERQTENSSGVKVWDLPPEWWFSGFGSAYAIFVNGNKTWKLASGDQPCDVTFVFSNGSLKGLTN